MPSNWGTPTWGDGTLTGSSGSGSAPVVASFTASATSITAGQSTTLSWSVTGADTVSIDQNIGTVDAAGSQTVSLSQTTVFTLTAQNSSGTTTATVTVAVNGGTGGSSPVISSFAASPANISTGASTQLAWTTTGATSVTIAADQGASPGGVALSGSIIVSPGSTTTYTLTASDANGLSTSATLLVTVGTGSGGGSAPVISSFSASPTSISSGGSSTLSWATTGATSVSISPNVGTVSGSGSQSVTLSASQTYTLTATNAQGTSKATVSIAVNGSTGGGSPVIADFTASPTTIESGTPTILSWSVTGATSVSIDNGIGSVSASGSISESPTSSTTYLLTATNATGSTTASLTITVTVTGPEPIIQSFTGSTATSTPGAAVTLSWSVIQADALTLNQGIGPVSGTSLVVNPQSTTTYRLTATNDVGSASATFTVSIRGAAAENVRFHQVRRNDREGDGSQFQMKGDGPDTSGWAAWYDDGANINAAQPRGNTTIVQCADLTGGYSPGNILIFDEPGNAKDSGIQVGDLLTTGSQGAWYGQVPRGAVNGANTVFHLDYSLANPFAILHLNGVVQLASIQGDPSTTNGTMAVSGGQFSISESALTVANAPRAGDTFYINYFRKDFAPVLNVTAATLVIWSSFTAEGGQPFGFADATFSLTPSGPSRNIYRTATLFGLRKDSDVISADFGLLSLPAPPSYFSGSYVRFLIDGTLTNTGDNSINIYDVYLNLTLEDGTQQTLRPIASGFYAGTGDNATSWKPSTGYSMGAAIVDSNLNKQIAQNTGVSGSVQPAWNTSGTTGDGSMIWSFYGGQDSITGKLLSNPARAYDADSDPPTTYATFQRTFYNGFAVGGYVDLIF